MRNLLFSLFKKLKKIENFFYKKMSNFLIGEKAGQRSNIFYHSIAVSRRSFSDWMYRQLKPKGIVLTDVQGSKMYVNTNETGVVPRLLTSGVMEKYETGLFKKMIKENMRVVDIGANIGYYTLIAARLVGKKGVVYAFEPVPSNYKLLCKNIKENNYTNIIPISKAVSNKRGKSKLWLDKIDLAIPSFSKDNVLFFSQEKALEKNNFVEAEVTTLDRFFKNVVGNNKIDLIKIDTQGAEGHIIDGAEEILKNNNNLKIFMEFWPDGIKKIGSDPLKLLYRLQEYGFKISIINETKQILEPIKDVFEFYKKIKPGEEFNLLLEK